VSGCRRAIPRQPDVCHAGRERRLRRCALSPMPRSAQKLYGLTLFSRAGARDPEDQLWPGSQHSHTGCAHKRHRTPLRLSNAATPVDEVEDTAQCLGARVAKAPTSHLTFGPWAHSRARMPRSPKAHQPPRDARTAYRRSHRRSHRSRLCPPSGHWRSPLAVARPRQ
jgi:hypothetical protein